MERTRWETTYKGYRRDILLNLTEMPWPALSKHHVLGLDFDSISNELVSPPEDVAEIAFLTTA